mgnify:CR=1 FL=1
MKLTKQQLKQIIVEELETEGLFGSGQKEVDHLHDYIEKRNTEIRNLLEPLKKNFIPGSQTHTVLQQVLEMVAAKPGDVHPGRIPRD